MLSMAAGALQLEIEHRREAEDGGPCLRIHGRAGAGPRQLLRFDLFERAPHYHVDPDGSDAITPLDPLRDNVQWLLETLPAGLPEWLEKAGFDGAAPATTEIEALRPHLEAELRNPPVDLDDLDLAVLHSRLSEKWRTYPEDVLPAWVAEMDYPLAEPIRLVLQRAIDRNDIGYPIDPRRTGLLEAFADRMHTRFGWEVDPSQTAILSDVVQGLYLGLGAFSEAGDGAVVLTPSYPPFLKAVSELDRSLVDWRLEPGDGRFELDFDALVSRCDARTRVLMLSNPHNPTGRVLERSELERLAELAVERNWVILSDEIHGDLAFAGHRHIPIASLAPEVAERTVTFTSATKAFNIAGLRCAVAHFGSAELQRRFDDWLPNHVRGGIGLLGLYATQAAWRHAQPWLDRVLAYLDENRRFAADFVRSRWGGVVPYVPEATFLMWLDFRPLSLDATPGRLLLREGRLALSDGRYFGAGLEGFARLNFATSRAILTQVLERGAAVLEGHTRR